MDEKLKKRLIGAAVLVSLAVIFLPMMLEEEPVIETGIYKTNIPPKIRVEQKMALPSKDKVSVDASAKIFGDSIKPKDNAGVTEMKDTADDSAGNQGDSAKVAKTRVGLTTWMLQVGSFSSRANASKLVNKLRAKGYDTHLEQAQVGSKTVFRVRVGPEVERLNAEKLLQKIADEFNIKGKVVRYP